MDFADNRRDEMIEYVKSKYGGRFLMWPMRRARGAVAVACRIFRENKNAKRRWCEAV
jgi:DNA polymerase III alpha subunit